MRRRALAAVLVAVCMMFGTAAPAWGATDAELQSLKQRMDQALSSYNQAEAEADSADAAHDAAVTKLNESKAALDKANKDVEDLQGSVTPSTGDKTVVDFLRWLQDRDLSAERRADVDNALRVFDQAPQEVTRYLKLGDPNDATSLRNMVTVAGESTNESFLVKAASLRKADGNSPTMVSMTGMVYAQLNADHAAYVRGHSGWFPSPGAENIAWGYPDPFSGWYDDEKEIFDNAVRQNPSLESCRHDVFVCSDSVPSAGHYLNIVDSEFSAIGLAFSYHNNQTAWAYDSGSDNGAFTIEDYRTYLFEFKKRVGGSSGSSELDAAKQRQEQAQKDYDEAARNEGLAATRYENALKTAREKYDEYKAARQAYKDAGGKVTEGEASGKDVAAAALRYVTANDGRFTDASWNQFKTVLDQAQNDYDKASSDASSDDYAAVVDKLKAGWERLVFAHSTDANVLGGSTVHRLAKGNDHFYTQNAGELQWLTSATGGSWSDENRLFEAPENEPGITELASFDAAAGNDQSVVDQLDAAADPIVEPVYRLYNTSNGDHVWTVDGNEVAHLSSLPEWNNEGAAFYTPAFTGTTDVVRLSKGNRHLLSTDANEIRVLAADGWTNEHAAFKAYGL